jgi:hypothetical protein
MKCRTDLCYDCDGNGSCIYQCAEGKICCHGECCDDIVVTKCYYVYRVGFIEPTTFPAGWTKLLDPLEGQWYLESITPLINGGCPDKVTFELDGQFVTAEGAPEELRTCCPDGCDRLRKC